MTDKNDLVVAIAASLYASRATDDALRAEPPLDALANEAWGCTISWSALFEVRKPRRIRRLT